MVPMKGQGTFLYNFTDGEKKILYGNFITAHISCCCLCMHRTSNTVGITKLEGKICVSMLVILFLYTESLKKRSSVHMVIGTRSVDDRYTIC